MRVTSSVLDWFKPRGSHCAGITTQTVVQHNYHNCYYIMIMSVLCWCWGWCVWHLLCTWNIWSYTYITVSVLPELSQRSGPRQEHISKKKQQEVAHKFHLYTHIAEAHAWLFSSSYGTHLCNYDCIPTTDWCGHQDYSCVNQHSFSYSPVIVLATTLRTTSGRGPKPCMDLDFTHTIKTSGTMRKITHVCVVAIGRYHSCSSGLESGLKVASF